MKYLTLFISGFLFFFDNLKAHEKKKEMRSNRIVLMAVAVIALGIFALPSTVSLFSGQHSWYELGAYGSQVPCEKCHSDIADEMASTGAHKDFPCENCHRTDADVRAYASEEGAGTGAHAASVEDCMICHDFECDGNYIHDYIAAADCLACHPMLLPEQLYPPTAGGFNLTNAPNDSGTKAAHKAFIVDSKNSTLMTGTNEACIACHTRVGVNITWTKNENLEFTVTEDSEGNWTIPSFAAGGENVTQVNSLNTWTNP